MLIVIKHFSTSRDNNALLFVNFIYVNFKANLYKTAKKERDNRNVTFNVTFIVIT